MGFGRERERERERERVVTMKRVDLGAVSEVHGKSGWDDVLGTKMIIPLTYKVKKVDKQVSVKHLWTSLTGKITVISKTSM